MIRPCGGNFIRNKEEFETMISSIEFCKELRIEGVVFEILDTANFLNIKEISVLTKIARPLKVALKGKETLRDMIRICQDQMEVMLAGKVTIKNVQGLHQFKVQRHITENVL